MELDSLEYSLDEELENELLYSILDEKLSNQEEKQNNEPEKKHKIRPRKKRKHEIKIRSVLLLLVTLIANTYAWFIYNSTVTTDIQVHLKSWKFELEAGEISEDFVFKVEEIYPGMPEASSSIVANNRGETDANLSCEIDSVRILDDEYLLLPTDENDRVPGVTYYTSQQLLDKLLYDYPFKIEIYIGDTLYDGSSTFSIPAGTLTTNISYKVNWPYETTGNSLTLDENDDIDTQWGERAYAYYNDENDPGDHYCIEVHLTIIATQSAASSTSEPDPEPDPDPDPEPDPNP